MIRRAAGMINRVYSDVPIVFTGGVAKNPCMTELLSRKLDREVKISTDPKFAGVCGAAFPYSAVMSCSPNQYGTSGIR